MDDPPEKVKLPLRLNDILSGTYYTLAITGILLGVVVWELNQANRIKELEQRERDHPTKNELIQTQGDVRQALQRIDDLDIHGTRALSDKVSILEQSRLVAEQRLNETRKTADGLQAEVSRIDVQLTQIKERQDVNSNAVRDLQERLYERGPTAPNKIR